MEPIDKRVYSVKDQCFTYSIYERIINNKITYWVYITYKSMIFDFFRTVSFEEGKRIISRMIYYNICDPKEAKEMLKEENNE
jgi:hypothetical protein